MKKYGLLGEKLSHSKSPEIHNDIFKYLEIEASYDLIETEKENLLKHIKKYDGLNVTIPYKTEVIKHLKDITDIAKKIGAVNTIYNEVGYNTDYYGFKKMLEINNISVSNKVVYILGTGGASKAVFKYLKDNNAKSIYFVSRTIKEENIISYDNLKNVEGDIIINTTPVGMYPDIDKSPVNEEILEKFKVAIDLIYNPYETKFLSISKELNLKTTNGLYMLIGQAIKAEEIWQECKIENEEIKKIYEKMKN
ncbi:shikimate dehydrogenase [Clostridiaceae bacterium HSG29]|nr:shikimate dehydrogenase [Clostridiaceae bacterium HSG29]